MATCFVYMTFPSREAAMPVARYLVEAQLAACTNLLPGMTSCYRWEGRIVEESEVVLIAKTTQARLPALRTAVIERHPYKLPCIVVLPLTEAVSHAPYLDWIAAETT